MNKFALFTLCDDTLLDSFKNSSYSNLKQYADNVSADFFIYGTDNDSNLWHQSNDYMDQFRWGVNSKFTYLKELLKTYDRILYIDADFVINLKIAPNIFDFVPEDSIGIYDELYYKSNPGYRDPEYPEDEIIHYVNRVYNESVIKFGKEPFDINLWNGAYYNNGMYVVSKQHVHVFDEPDEYIRTKWHIQDYTNYVIRRSKVPVKILGPEWNNFVRLYPEDIFMYNRFFIHFAACGNNHQHRFQLMDDYMERAKTHGSL